MTFTLLSRWLRGLACGILRRDHCDKRVKHFADGRIMGYCGICGRCNQPERVIYGMDP